MGRRQRASRAAAAASGKATEGTNAGDGENETSAAALLMLEEGAALKGTAYLEYDYSFSCTRVRTLAGALHACIGYVAINI